MNGRGSRVGCGIDEGVEVDGLFTLPKKERVNECRTRHERDVCVQRSIDDGGG